MKIVTHNVKFHPDDVFAVATLLLRYPDSEIIRTREQSLIDEADIVVDVGGVYDPIRKRFDHHQIEGAGTRDNGVPYASFGLVWKEYGEEICGSAEVAKIIDLSLVQPIDAGDCGFEITKSIIPGVRNFSVVSVIGLYKPTWKEGEDFDTGFVEAVKWARGMMERLIKVERDGHEASEIVLDAYNNSVDKRLVVVDTDASLGREIVNGVLNGLPEPLYAVLFRRDHQTWQLLSINKDRTTYELRKPLPESWRGKKGEELELATAVSGSVFCHNSGFMCIVDTKDGAVMLAEKALNA